MICVVGGSNIDLQGFSDEEISFNDSNPGRIEKGFGGVARNICENLARLNLTPKFITPIGDGVFSKSLLEYMNNLNVDMKDSLIIENEDLSTYLSILNDKNEMILAISSMKILENLNLNFIKNKEEILKKFEVIVIDTNLREDVIEYILSLNKKVIIDLVSTKKALKVKNNIGKFYAIKPNKIEIEVLTGIKIIDEKTMIEACDFLLSKGVKQVFLTLGKDGIFYKDKNKYKFIKNPKVDVKDITGAGDAFTSGIAYSTLLNYDIEKTAKFSMTMSLINVTNIGTCYKKLNLDLVKEKYQEYFKEKL